MAYGDKINFEKIKDEYYKKDDELQKEREKLYDNYKNKLEDGNKI